MRKSYGWWSAGIVALMAATGCEERRDAAGTRQGPQEAARGQVEQAQQKTEEAFDQAKEAQAKASDQQQSATEAQEDVERARQELSEAQAKAQQETQEAQQAQQGALKQSEQAQRTASQSQQEALQAQTRAQQEATQRQQQAARAMQPPAQAGTGGSGTGGSGPPGEQTVTADVVKASEQELVLGEKGEPSMRLTLNPQTQVMVDGRAARATDIQEGAQVRASYRSENGQQVATRVEAQSAAAVQPASPESGESAKPRQ